MGLIRRNAPTYTTLLLTLVACSGCARSTQAPPKSVPLVPDGRQSFEAGGLAFRQGDPARAEQYLKLALQQGHDRRQTVGLLIRVCLSSARLRGALNYAEPFLQDHPEELELRYLVATVYWSLGQTERALRQVQRIILRDPGHAAAHYLQGLALASHDVVQAEKSFRRYLELAPRDIHAGEVRSRLEEIALLQREAPGAIEQAEARSKP